MTWYLDTIDETATEDTFGIVKTATQGFQDGEFRADMINLNIFAKSLTTAELKAGLILEGIDNHYISIIDYVGETGDTVGKIRVKNIDWNNVGNTEGYYQINLGIHYEY